MSDAVIIFFTLAYLLGIIGVYRDQHMERLARKYILVFLMCVFPIWISLTVGIVKLAFGEMPI